jgi:hypothetical protein
MVVAGVTLPGVEDLTRASNAALSSYSGDLFASASPRGGVDPFALNPAGSGAAPAAASEILTDRSAGISEGFLTPVPDGNNPANENSPADDSKIIHVLLALRSDSSVELDQDRAWRVFSDISARLLYDADAAAELRLPDQP